MQKVIKSNYGSIPHLSDSKLTQQADKKIQIDQEYILTKKGRDWKDTIIVTEKIDGSNVGVVKIGCEIYPITRSGYSAISSPYKHHIIFDLWAKRNSHLFNWLPNNYRVVGEWCIMAHGTIMDISNESPFVAFDIIDDSNKRVPFFDFVSMCSKHDIPIVPVLHVGQPVSIKNAIKLLGEGHYGKPEKPEGFVYRCEREGKVDFLAKWVRHDKEDGKYIHEEIYNIGYANVLSSLQ